MFTAIRRASSLVSGLVSGASIRPLLEKHMRKRLTVVVAHNKGGGPFLNGPWRRKVLTRFHEINGPPRVAPALGLGGL